MGQGQGQFKSHGRGRVCRKRAKQRMNFRLFVSGEHCRKSHPVTSDLLVFVTEHLLDHPASTAAEPLQGPGSMKFALG